MTYTDVSAPISLGGVLESDSATFGKDSYSDTADHGNYISAAYIRSLDTQHLPGDTYIVDR